MSGSVDQDALSAMETDLDEDTKTFWTGICFDLHSFRQNPTLEGWTTETNHFVAMDTSVSFGDVCIPPDVLSPTHHMVSKALAWLGIGMWVIAERYYRTVLFMDFASNNYLSALICGANLGLCYLGGGDTASAYRLTTQLLPLAIRTNNIYPGTRIATINRFSLGQMGDWAEAWRETERLQPGGFSAVDDDVSQILTGVWQAINDRSSLLAWGKQWKHFKTRFG